MRPTVLALTMMYVLGCQPQESANYSEKGDSLTVAEVTVSGDTSGAAGDASARVVGCGDGNECDDGLFCTTDSCVDGVCVWAVVPYFCAIDGVCVAANMAPTKASPDNPCVTCLPEIDQWGWAAHPLMDGKVVLGHYKCLEGEPCPWALNCHDRECGDDGCGGDCSEQTNPLAACMDSGMGAYCDFDGICKCEPDCSGKDCGDDGCKGSCGDCNGGDDCNGGVCGGPCLPDCTEPYGSGYGCGGDGCGGSCGECPVGYQCSEPEVTGHAGKCYANGCFQQPGPGCDGCACEDCVCDSDPYCCEVKWDIWCAGLCGNSCGDCLPLEQAD